MSLLCIFASDKQYLPNDDRIINYKILPEDNIDDYQNLVYDYDIGQLISKYKSGTPNEIHPIYFKGNNLIFLLGYNEYLEKNHKLLDNDNHSISQLLDKIKSSDGEYVCSIYDSEKDCFHLINDRFSSRPCYVKQEQNNIIISTNLAFLLKMSNEKNKFDKLGLFQILCYDHTIGSRTNFEGIKRVKPATHLVVYKDKLEEKQYWKLTYKKKFFMNPEKFSEKVFSAFKRSVENRAENHKGFSSLSGGLDSRLIAYCLPKDDYFCFTFVDSMSKMDTAEVLVAKEVADRLSLEHKVGVLESVEVSNHINALTMLTGGLVAIHHPIKTMQFIKEMKKSGFHLGGGPGDVLAGSYIPRFANPDAEKKTFKKKIIDDYCGRRRKYNIDALNLILKEDITENISPKISNSMKHSFDEINESTAGQMITKWAMTIRQPAFTFASPVHNHPDVAESSPHLGYKYSDYMLMLSLDWLYDKNFYKYMIYRWMDELRDVIYGNTGKLIYSPLIDKHFDDKDNIIGKPEIDKKDDIDFEVLLEMNCQEDFQTIDKFNQVSNKNITQQGLELTSEGRDPFIFLPLTDFDNYNALRIDIDITSPEITKLQLFFREIEQEVFSEKNSKIIQLKKGYNSISFDIKNKDFSKEPLRLDPGTTTGKYIIHKVIVKGYVIEEDKKSNDFHYDLLRGDSDLLSSLRDILQMDNGELSEFLDIDKTIKFIDEFEEGKIKIAQYDDSNIIGWLSTVLYSYKLFLKEELES
jgi:hypothetical protein